ncbi:MAG: class I SAM-dependent methyltransferase [Thermodesulfobacteriota bacterium]
MSQGHKRNFLNFIKKLLRSFDVRFNFYRSLHSASKVLDLGCEHGWGSIELKNMYPEIEVHGIDILPESEIPGFICYTVTDLDEGLLPYPDSHFDAVIFSHVIEHLRAPMQLGKEIHRVMKSGAQIYVEAPNWTTILVPSCGFHREQLNPFNFFDDPTHLQPWTKQGLFSFLSQGCHLQVRKVGSVRNWLRIPLDLIRIIVGLIAGNRSKISNAFRNVYGWSIYGVGIKVS